MFKADLSGADLSEGILSGADLSGADLRELANDFIDGINVESLVATLDEEVPIDLARVQSPPGGFGVRVSANNALFGDLTSLFEGTVSLHAVVDDYWGFVTASVFRRT